MLTFSRDSELLTNKKATQNNNIFPVYQQVRTAVELVLGGDARMCVLLGRGARSRSAGWSDPRRLFGHGGPLRSRHRRYTWLHKHLIIAAIKNLKVVVVVVVVMGVVLGNLIMLAII